MEFQGDGEAMTREGFSSVSLRRWAGLSQQLSLMGAAVQEQLGQEWGPSSPKQTPWGMISPGLSNSPAQLGAALGSV